MQYMNMLPYQVRKALENRTPAVLPLGVVEYHGEHLPLGVDSFICSEAIRRVEMKHPELIVLPPFHYGAASYAVAAPERNGSLQVDSHHLIPVAEDIFLSLLRVGFRNIHAFIAHQDGDFEQGMPTDLAFRFAARHVLMDWMDRHHGEGWWGTDEFAAKDSTSEDPFRWIQIHSTNSVPSRKNFPGDHAGKGETSQIMAIHPELVEKDRITEKPWYTETGLEASAEYGDAFLDSEARDIEKILFPETSRSSN